MTDQRYSGSLASCRLLTVPIVLMEQAGSRPERPAIQLVGEEPVTYRQLLRDAAALAAGLGKAGVARGETVVILAPNSYETICSWLALGLAGAVEVCINTAYRGASLEHALNNSRARHLITFAEHVPTLLQSLPKLAHLEQVFVVGDIPAAARDSRLAWRPFHELPNANGIDAVLAQARSIAPSEIASVIYTSGTTGPAKGVLMPHAQVCLLAATTVRGLGLDGEDCFYCFHPMFHMAGKFMAVLGTFMTGGLVVLDRSFQPGHWLDRVREYRATAGLAHGPMLEMIHAQPERPDDHDNPVRRILTAPFPKRIARDVERRFALKGIEVWGMTEVGVPVWHPLDEPLREGSCGRNDDELFDVRVVDPATDEELPPGTIGELVVRPRYPWILMQGYLGMAEQTVETWRNLWFHTGDSAYRDADGWFYFVDRMKDRIRRRAESISSYDIESAALAHPDILEAAAVGVPSEFEGDDDVKLCVVPRPGVSLDMKELLAYLARQLPHHMVPRYIECLEALPRTPTNKVRKNELRARGVGAQVWDRKSAGISLQQFYDQGTAPGEGNTQ